MARAFDFCTRLTTERPALTLPRELLLNPLFLRIEFASNELAAAHMVRCVFRSHGGEFSDQVVSYGLPYSTLNAVSAERLSYILSLQLLEMCLTAESRFDSGGLCAAEREELEEWRAERAWWSDLERQFVVV